MSPALVRWRLGEMVSNLGAGRLSIWPVSGDEGEVPGLVMTMSTQVLRPECRAG